MTISISLQERYANDWAVFGEIERRHGLIDSSLTLNDRHLLERMKALSDRPSSDPPAGTPITPYLSGFSYDRWYVLMRTFSDPTATRGGMVRSFCLLLPIDRLTSIDDLSIPIDYLPATNSTPNEWNSWNGKDRVTISNINSDEILSERKPADIANLTPLSIRLGLIIALLENNLPVIWTDSQDNFEMVLTSIWALLPPALRSILRFGRSYSPNDLGQPQPHFVTTPNNAVSRWNQTGIFQLVDRQPNSRAQSFLLGDSSANSLGEFLSSLPIANEFNKLNMADTCLTAIEAVETGELSSAITAARLIEELAPESYQAQELKISLVNTLENIIQTGDTKDIIRFSNLSLNAFANVHERLRNSLTARIKSDFTTFHNIDQKLVELAFNEVTASWWKIAVSGEVIEQVSKLSPELAINLWNWWLNNPSLVVYLKNYLPNNADRLLYETAPKIIEKKSANSILKIFSDDLNSESISFPRLLTYLRVMSRLPNDHVLQMCLDRSLNDVEIALNIFRQCVGNRVFLDLALTASDERIHTEAGVCCFHEPNLLNQIVPSNVSWRTIWLAAIRSGADPLAGINRPQEVIATVLDELLLGENINPNLLISLSFTRAANLIDYSSRPNIWSRLTSDAKSGFLEATTKGVLDCWRDNSYFQLEPELVQSILKPGYLSEAARQSDRSLSKMTSNYIKFLLVQQGNILNAEEIVKILYQYTLAISDIEVRQFAEWIRTNHWTQIAETAFDYYKKRKSSIIFHAITEHTLNILPGLKQRQAAIELKLTTKQIDMYQNEKLGASSNRKYINTESGAIKYYNTTHIANQISAGKLSIDDQNILIDIIADLGFASSNYAELFRDWLHRADLPKEWIMSFGQWPNDIRIAARQLITWAESKGMHPQDHDFSTLGSILNVLISGETGFDKASLITGVIVRYNLIYNEDLLNEIIIKYQASQ
jgi:hypothetical protein